MDTRRFTLVVDVTMDIPVSVTECRCGKLTDNVAGLCDACLKEEVAVERGEEERYERVMGGAR
jgi:hypothetical protein